MNRKAKLGLMALALTSVGVAYAIKKRNGNAKIEK